MGTALEAIDRTGRGISMDELLRGYLPILIFLGLAVAIAGAALLASYIIAHQRPDS